ncbi:S-adenosyl-methyltransferase MraW [Anaeromyxobacter dehalogenans 2CP-1]|uniref:Ribosomal RNA small subunit methyltransferase H n=1 Tax=Anaeromyxobacter dehalogenans (strain ATCC BAA-258 / DSM 21875 / 2CP-1) TaxID=455488 RepID=RSMH_ANAD2|nr:16S rRNA (cytosine(1402)-N(4))-methyltransferase RsmH [Anaeromyxobacter dehalogenans]B8J8E0.1 RecName: Full=Ribosomal RNA small subunit methyltransferase H; AltName: Full=16S rRNA m(4)C1402 methyltransferase; AltName: Full=rRNA (cytosine-N(4)-)-methyltransferase RsmH [Anaeromyxobacter dehalogenans 2CP-1]ACL67226.1 S-adenosyl-methyltransferase MraW [Anaeromyxobacter dehalogenans 2CP-1]
MSADFRHEPVLANEILELLRPRPGELFLDGTLGGGGHSGLLLEAGARVIALDKDPRALAAATARLARFGEAFRAVRSDFRDAKNVLEALGIAAVDGALVDLGVSSPQLDEAERGFSFSRPGPLDMRMGDTGETLEDLLRRIDERELARILREYGEEPFARPVARAVKAALETEAPLDTARLAEVVAGAIPRKAWPHRIHPATRTFQALRIAVNDELGALAAWLDGLPGVLAPGGRAAAISFHSLEDRMVKEKFRALTQACTCPPDLPVCACGAKASFAAITRKAVKASDEEIARNPRARSARLRAVEKLR